MQRSSRALVSRVNLARLATWTLAALAFTSLAACDASALSAPDIDGDSAAVGAPATTGAALAPLALNATGQTILEATNRSRADAGLRALQHDGRLAAAAQRQAEQIAATGTFAHDIAGTAYPTLVARLNGAGLTNVAAAENIALGYAVAQVVDGWMSSTGHRANILGAYTHLGTGEAVNSRGQRVLVQVFGALR